MCGPESDAIPLVGPPWTGIARLAVGQKRNVAGGQVIAVELEELAPADVFLEDERISLYRFVLDAAGDAVREEGELRTCAAGELDLMHLRRIRKAGGDQHLAAHWMPAGEARRPKIAVTLHGLGNTQGNLRDSFDYEVFIGDDLSFLGRDRN